MKTLILKDVEAFSKLNSISLAEHSFIAYGDGQGFFRIIKDRRNVENYGTKITSETLHWYLKKY